MSYGGRGYHAACGWIQLVRSSDAGGDEFELDPFEPLGATPHPFCWFGFAPTLFDAPWRDDRADVDWLAHSFLGFIASPGSDREARAVLGFGWGFSIAGGAISFKEPEPLGEADWNGHLPLLRREHPAWSFTEGYRVD